MNLFNIQQLQPKLFTTQAVSAEYLPVLIFLAVALGLSLLIIVLPFFINKLRPDKHKNSPYECGFEGSGEVRNKFNVKFSN